MPITSTSSWKTCGTYRKTSRNLPTPSRPGRTRSSARALRASINRGQNNEFIQIAAFLTREGEATFPSPPEACVEDHRTGGDVRVLCGWARCGLRRGAPVQVLSACHAPPDLGGEIGWPPAGHPA